SRDESSDDEFVYAVTSTGVYCRPSCPSRRPRLSNVRFYADPEAAELAGFRPCLRCDPRGPGAAARRRDVVARACRIIDEAPEPLALADLARAVGTSKFHFHRLFTRETGITPRAYMAAKRSARVQHELRNGESVTRAVYDAGFGSAARFYEGASAR